METQNKFNWEIADNYLDIEVDNGSTTRTSDYITLRQFKSNIENGISLKKMREQGISKHLLQFFSNFCQGKISLSYDVFKSLYHSGVELESISKLYHVARNDLTFLRQLYQIDRKGAKFIQRKKNDIPLTQRQKEIVYGCQMGDAKRSHTKWNSSFTIKQGDKQKDYVAWKYSELLNICRDGGIRQTSYFDERYQKTYTSIFFDTKANSDIEFINNQFYKTDKKEVTREILDNLSILSISVWFMDDGYTDKNKYGITNVVFCTDSFSKESCENIVEWFKEKWDIDAHLRERPLKYGMGYRVIIKAESSRKLIKMIEPYLLPSMMYKIQNKNASNNPKNRVIEKVDIEIDESAPLKNKYDFLTEELLREEYVDNGLSDKEIAYKYGMGSKTVVWRKRKKFGIENKCAGKSNSNAKKNRKFEITKDMYFQYKDKKMTHQQIADELGCSKVVVQRRMAECDTR